jgi:hypothetical protein
VPERQASQATLLDWSNIIPAQRRRTGIEPA